VTGLGATPVNALLAGSTLYAATAGGLSAYNNDATGWTNDATVTNVNGVYTYGSFTYEAADGGVYVFNGTGQTSQTTTPASSVVSGASKVTCVIADPYGDIFAGTDAGLGISGSALGLSFGTDELGSGAHVYGLAFDSYGTLFVATNLGLYVIGSSIAHPLSTPIYSVAVDGAGNVYVGTATGVEELASGASTPTTLLTTASPVVSIVTTTPVYQY
jgi:ligand-binding sensor domain-containing protein